MHLFNLNNFSDRFGIDMNEVDFNTAVTEASIAATQAVASRFRFQSFAAYTARRDIFRVDRTFGAGNQQHRDFRLSRGFIDTSSGFSAYYTDNIIHVRNNDTDNLTDLQDVAEDGESDYLIIDAEQGKLTSTAIDLTDQWVVVTYNGGLSVATDDEFEDVPDWLDEAAQLQAAMFLKQNRALKADDGEDELKPLRDAYDIIHSTHSRIYPAALLPTASEPGR